MVTGNGDSLLRSTLTGVLAAGMVAGTMLAAIAQNPTPSPSPTPSPPPTLRDRTSELWQEHQLTLILAGILTGSALLTYLGVLWFRPLLLLKLSSTDIPIPWKDIKVPLGLVRWLKYRDRVLDAWVNKHWEKAKDEFLELPTVQDRKIHIALPVYLNQRLEENLDGDKLSETFSKKSAVVLITGEGCLKIAISPP
jgi:hypothetical protein